ncbi:unnamed protein product [Caenorhabditis angaria]|uniref:UPAR/Ly6 domain-containing protein n=1 Tax=Caenorhabditis angaria TaxID=860376 RepID=A0A9P1J2I1_9PELO|nr:unnamed protein product [Caenorhabditis angaria]
MLFHVSFILLVYFFTNGTLALIECIKCDTRLTAGEECTNCTGDFCMLLMYAYTYPGLAGKNVIYQDCMLSPIKYNTGCTKNQKGDILCLCNDTDNCNQESNFNLITAPEPTFFTCTSYTQYPWSAINFVYECPNASFCRKYLYSRGDESQDCQYAYEVLDNFNQFFTWNNLILPVNSCYTNNGHSGQVCSYTDDRNSTYKEKHVKKVKCYVGVDAFQYRYARNPNDTCEGQYCFATDLQYGCVTQFFSEGLKLEVGLYQYASFTQKFYICDKSMCNNITFSNLEQDCDCPTTYILDHSNQHFSVLLIPLQMLLLLLL